MMRTNEGDNITLKILDLHYWRKMITQTTREKSGSRDVLDRNVIQFGHSSKK